jgi:pimeloyl-ACP methyl ester carboxylesterase
MELFEQGHGAPLVFIPGMQGRWEYTRPTVDALSRDFHVLAFSLADEPAAGFPFEPARGFDSYADQVTAALDAGHAPRAVICGISFGGLVALRFAARHPERVAALILASTPGPGWHLKPRHDLYARWPKVFVPLFLIEAPLRARPELAAALPNPHARRAFSRRILRTVVTAPLSPTRMAWRARLIGSYDAAADCARIGSPTLVVTGERSLDHVVPVEGSSRYSTLIAGAVSSVLPATGHQGSLTHADAFATMVREFVAARQSARVT